MPGSRRILPKRGSSKKAFDKAGCLCGALEGHPEAEKSTSEKVGFGTKFSRKRASGGVFLSFRDWVGGILGAKDGAAEERAIATRHSTKQCTADESSNS